MAGADLWDGMGPERSNRIGERGRMGRYRGQSSAGGPRVEIREIGLQNANADARQRSLKFAICDLIRVEGRSDRDY